MLIYREVEGFPMRQCKLVTMGPPLLLRLEYGVGEKSAIKTYTVSILFVCVHMVGDFGHLMMSVTLTNPSEFVICLNVAFLEER